MTFDEAIAAGKVTQQEAHSIFDSLPTVDPREMLGTWKGSEFPTGHPADGGLTATGWFGKRFRDVETVDPLLFYTEDRTAIFAVDPLRMDVLAASGRQGKAADFQEELETDKPTARLRTVVFRDKATATMIYDQRPVNDHFRRVDQNTLLGAMDARGDDMNYFFVLRRVDGE